MSVSLICYYYDFGVTFSASRIVSGQPPDGDADYPKRLNHGDGYLEVYWARELKAEFYDAR